VNAATAELWGAQAPRVSASRTDSSSGELARRLAERTFSEIENPSTKQDFGEAPKTAREARALPGACAFTLMELLIVIAIIAVLAGLVLATAGYVQKKGKRSRAEAEIAAMSAALENYKADNGGYPRDALTDNFNVATANIASYEGPSLKLYEYLSGDTDHDRIPEVKVYFPFKPNQLSPVEQTNGVTSIRDPFGNPYGYSTMKASNSSLNGHNPTFDLWSVGDGTAGTDETKWIKNW
jgi:prepilin-type N-terminal cleavage/methylation domain-containing protein